MSKEALIINVWQKPKYDCCTFRFVDIFHYVEIIILTYCLHLQFGMSFLTKFWHSDQRFRRNILHPYAQNLKDLDMYIWDCLLINTIYNFPGMVSIENLLWAYPLTNRVSRWRHEFGKYLLVCYVLLEMSNST